MARSRMKPVITLTLNPAIDGAEQVRPIRKIRTWGERYDAGGGGINAARRIDCLVIALPDLALSSSSQVKAGSRPS